MSIGGRDATATSPSGPSASRARSGVQLLRLACALCALEPIIRNASGQGHSTVNFPVRNEGGRCARLLINTVTPI